VVGGGGGYLRALSWAVGMAMTRLLVPYCINLTALAVLSSTRMWPFLGSGTSNPALFGDIEEIGREQRGGGGLELQQDVAFLEL